MFLDVLKDAFLASILFTGLVVVMMMVVECLVGRGGTRVANSRFFRFKPLQVLYSSLLGILPGCVGGFACVSLYESDLLSFGALTAMLIATSGDEAFAMLAMFPSQSLWIFLALLIIAIASGLIVDFIVKKPLRLPVVGEYEIHVDHIPDDCPDCLRIRRHRFILFASISVYIVLLLCGVLSNEHEHEEVTHFFSGLDLLSEEWIYWVFAAFSLIVLGVVIGADGDFVENRLWENVAVKHALSVFVWTFGTLFVMGILLNFLDIELWISDNALLMVLLAAAIGLIPESGPHLIFVTLYASGVLPVGVLLASCISQDGHASLPLLARSRRDFLKAKGINFAVAALVGAIALLI